MSQTVEPLEREATTIVVLPTCSEYARDLERLIYAGYHGDPERVHYDDVSAERFVRHTQIFPQGQFTAIEQETGRVVGMTSSMIIDYDPAQPLLESWYETTDQGWLTPHNPRGEWMYGVESVVHPDYQGHGIGSKLMNARFQVLHDLNLRGMIAGSLFVDYAEYADQMSVDQYIEAVKAGQIFDHNLSKQLHKGFRVANIIPDYVDEPRTRNYAAAIVWENRDYIPHTLDWMRTPTLPASSRTAAR